MSKPEKEPVEEHGPSKRSHHEGNDVDDTEMKDAAPTKKKQKTKPHHFLHQHTLRKPTWTYFHLQLFSSPASSSFDELDILSAKKHINSALRTFLGLHGTAISVDILKTEGKNVWIRVPREDATTVHEAISGWSGSDEGVGIRWVVKGRDEWLARLAAGDGKDLFGG